MDIQYRSTLWRHSGFLYIKTVNEHKELCGEQKKKKKVLNNLECALYFRFFKVASSSVSQLHEVVTWTVLVIHLVQRLQLLFRRCVGV